MFILISLNDIIKNDNIEFMEVLFHNDRTLKDFDALSTDMQAHFARILDTMEECGTWNLGMPQVRPLKGSSLYEIRLKGKAGIARAIFVSIVKDELMILNVFVKKSQKAPKKEIDIALKRLKEAKNGK